MSLCLTICIPEQLAVLSFMRAKNQANERHFDAGQAPVMSAVVSMPWRPRKWHLRVCAIHGKPVVKNGPRVWGGHQCGEAVFSFSYHTGSTGEGPAS